VDGREVSLPQTMAYKGMMLSGVPNFVFTVGYTNASWTLKADLVSGFVVRLLRHLDRRGYDQFVPVNEDPGVTPRPLLDFQAGYVLRSVDEFPRTGSRQPWRLGMSYAHDVVNLRYRRIDDGVLRFSHRPAGGGTGGTAPAQNQLLHQGATGQRSIASATPTAPGVDSATNPAAASNPSGYPPR
jgi:hypothetical protein